MFNNDKENEKLWNLLIYKFYGTNEEMEQMMPFVWAMFTLMILGTTGFIIYRMAF